MEINFLIILTFLLSLIVWYIVTPLIEGTKEIPTQINQHELNRNKTVLLRQIKELEMDYHIGNVSEEDFNNTRNELKNEISTIITNIKNIS